MQGIKCIGPIFDMSGYAEWCRSYILALIKEGVPITIGVDEVRGSSGPIKFEEATPDLGEDGNLLYEHLNKKIPYDAAIAWLTPDWATDQLGPELNKGIKRINMTLWETDRLPAFWLPHLAKFDQVWVPGLWNKQVFEESLQRVNIKVPVKVVHTPVDPNKYHTSKSFTLDRLGLSGVDDSYFMFFFISQWTDRKNFADLLYAYWAEFTENDKTILVIKTYIANNSAQDKEQLRNLLTHLAKTTGKAKLPKFAYIHDVLSTETVYALHQRANCFVSPSRGEGLGLGILEALMFDTPIVSNAFGEQTLYLLKDGSITYPHTLTPVRGMPSHINGLYTSDQWWAAPDVRAMATSMRTVFEDKVSNQLFNLQACKEKITSYFSSQECIKEITEALQQ